MGGAVTLGVLQSMKTIMSRVHKRVFMIHKIDKS
jgi:hypothetical protein